MYYEYFGLKQPPFRITPDTRLFFPGGDRGAVLEALVYAVLNGEGIVKVVGEVGSGKTMLCRMLEQELPKRVEIVYLANPSLSPDNILHAIAFELKLPVHTGSSRLEVMNELQNYLLDRHSKDHQVVVFVEEAQSMPIATLEEIRLLSNLETQQNKLLQIVLFGQPELDEMIKQPEIRQLKERITYSFQLRPFATADIRDYLIARLRACGYRVGELFGKPAVKEIEKYSKGLLRRVNIMADKALLAAYADNTSQVTRQHVRKAAYDSEFIGNWRSRWKNWRLSAVFAAAVLVLGLAALTWRYSGSSAAEHGNAGERPRTAPAEHRLPTAAIARGGKRAAAGGAAETETPSGVPIAAAPGADVAGVATGADLLQLVPGETEADTGPRNPGLPPTAGGQIAAPDAASQHATVAGTLTTVIPVDEKPAGIEAQLLGLKALFSPVPRRTLAADDEGSLLLRQLRVLPPETARLGPSEALPEGDTCQVCWSIIYRPLIDPENL